MGIWFSRYGVLLPEAVDGAGGSDWLGAALTACGGADAVGWLETALETSGATGSDTTGSDAACDEAAGNWEDASAWDAAGSPCPQPASAADSRAISRSLRIVIPPVMGCAASHRFSSVLTG